MVRIVNNQILLRTLIYCVPVDNNDNITEASKNRTEYEPEYLLNMFLNSYEEIEHSKIVCEYSLVFYRPIQYNR